MAYATVLHCHRHRSQSPQVSIELRLSTLVCYEDRSTHEQRCQGCTGKSIWWIMIPICLAKPAKDWSQVISHTIIHESVKYPRNSQDIHSSLGFFCDFRSFLDERKRKEKERHPPLQIFTVMSSIHIHHGTETGEPSHETETGLQWEAIDHPWEEKADTINENAQ